MTWGRSGGRWGRKAGGEGRQGLYLLGLGFGTLALGAGRQWAVGSGGARMLKQVETGAHIRRFCEKIF
jgi:hypothetical protein